MKEFKYSEKECNDFYMKLRKRLKKSFSEKEKSNSMKHIPDFAVHIIDYLCFFPDIVYLTFKLIFDKSIPLDPAFPLIITRKYL